jgi:hypothetical protein
MQKGVGHLLGYISLCSGYINSSSVYHNLIQSELISSSYLSEREVSISGNGYTEMDSDIYLLYKRTPRVYLFVIYPVEFKIKKNAFSSAKINTSTWTGQTISYQPSFTTVNGDLGGNIIWNNIPVFPAVPAVGFQQNYFLQPPQQIIIDDPIQMVEPNEPAIMNDDEDND